MEDRYSTAKEIYPAASPRGGNGEAPALDAKQPEVRWVLEELHKFGRLHTLKPSALSAEDLREVCESIRKEVFAEIETGNTVFGADELTVAFELELKKYGLHKAYKKMLDGAEPPRSTWNVHTDANENGKEEIDKAVAGFSKMEVKMIPRSAREAINLRFSQMTIQGRARRKAQDISESDAACISDIVRILLTYQDGFGQQFHDRLGLSDDMIWALLHEYDISVLGADELEALVLLTEEANGLGALKEKLNDDALELQIQYLRHMVLYRRLIRMEHAPDAEAQLQKVMDALELSEKEYASAEHMHFAGMSNHDIAPDLFPYGEDGNSLSELLEELQGIQKSSLVPQAIRSEFEGIADLYPEEFEHLTAATAPAHGILNWYPKPTDTEHYPPSTGMPGSEAKLADLERRVSRGLPLWHPEDRLDYEFLGVVRRNEIPRISFSRDEEEEEEEEAEDEVGGKEKEDEEADELAGEGE